MKTILNIAGTELRTLFYSPIAWFLMIVFMVQCGFVYFNMLDSYARGQEMGGMSLEYMQQLTQGIFAGNGGVFWKVMDSLYLYLPLLTMGLISREFNGGTIRLLYSSPVKVKQIVFGKYLAMLVYSLLLVMVLGIFLVAGMFHIKSPDIGMLLSSAFGFFLLLCAYSSIGLFMSSLSTYQVVAAVSTFVMIGALTYIGNLWQQYDFVRDLTYFLSINGRAEKILLGLITTKDLLYFVLIVFIFLSLSILKLNFGRESKSSLYKTLRYTAVIVFALAIGYIGSRPGLVGYLDVTAAKSRTLTPNAQKILAELGEEPLKVTVYNNLLSQYAWYGLPEARNAEMNRWEPYLRFKSNISFNHVNYYDSALDDKYAASIYDGKTLKEAAERFAKNYDMKVADFVTPEAIRKEIDLRPEMNRYVMQLNYKGRNTFLRIFNDQGVFPSETEVSAAFKRLLMAKLPKVTFLTGNLERSIEKMGDREYKTLTNLYSFRYALINQGFDVDTISLETQEIPSDVSTLVIADPKRDLSPATLEKIRRYIDQGRNLIIAGEPGKQSVLNPLLDQLGVQLMPGTLVQPSKEFAPDLVLGGISPAAAAFTKNLAKAAKDSLPVTTPGATGLSYIDKGFTVTPLLSNNPAKSWIKKDKLVVDSADVAFNTASGDQKISVPLVLGLTRKVNGKEQRIVVAGDADFLNNSELGRFNIRVANFHFNTGLFSWLCNGDFPIDTSRPDSKDNRVTISTDQLERYKIFFLWILPGILVAVASILLIRRKRK